MNINPVKRVSSLNSSISKRMQVIMPPQKIIYSSSIQFSSFSSTQITQASNMKLATKQLYLEQGNTAQFGPLDKRLGVSQKMKTCKTCFQNLAQCPGHFGYLKLQMPVFNVGFFKHLLIIIQCVCKKCSRIMLKPQDRATYLRKFKRKNLDSLQRFSIFKKVMEICKRATICPFCNAYNGVVKKMPGFPLRIIHNKFTNSDEIENLNNQFQYALSLDSNFSLDKSIINKISQELNPLDILNVFERIPQQDIVLLNMDPLRTRPTDLLMHEIFVPPVCIRPSVQVRPGVSNQDDLTIKIGEMIQINNLLKVNIDQGLPIKKLLEHWQLLQYTIAQYINSQTPGLPLNLLGNKQIRALSQRLKGKHGRFRGNLSGKRVDFSG